MTDRRAGSVGLNVDIATATIRQAGRIGLNVDLKTPSAFATVAAMQTTAVSLQSVYIPGTIQYPVTVSTTQQTEATCALARNLSAVVVATQEQAALGLTEVALSLEISVAQAALGLTVERSADSARSFVLAARCDAFVVRHRGVRFTVEAR